MITTITDIEFLADLNTINGLIHVSMPRAKRYRELITSNAVNEMFLSGKFFYFLNFHVHSSSVGELYTQMLFVCSILCRLCEVKL